MAVSAEQKAVLHVELSKELWKGQCQMNKKLPVQKQKIITLDAKNLFKASEALTEEKDESIKVDLTDKFTSRAIVKQEAMMETCPLFDQLLMVLKDNGEDNMAADGKSQGMALYDQLLIMDFDDIFLLDIDSADKSADESAEEKKQDWRENAQYLIEYGMDVHFEDYASCSGLPLDIRERNTAANAFYRTYGSRIAGNPAFGDGTSS